MIAQLVASTCCGDEISVGDGHVKMGLGGGAGLGGCLGC